MAQDQSASLKGQFLLAMPSLLDPNFYQTVTCICEHNENGAMGIIVNRVHHSLTAKDIFEELAIENVPGTQSIPIYLGGPVHVGEIFVLHGPPLSWKSSLMITPSLAMTNTRDILKRLPWIGDPGHLLSFWVVPVGARDSWNPK